jgi:hypothetical protein
MEEIPKPPWNGLSGPQQKVYTEKAAYLIENGYEHNLSIEEFAEKIYMMEK